MNDPESETERRDASTTSTDQDQATYNPYDRDPPRCRRRCKDGTICDRLVPLAGVACHHHLDQDQPSSEQVADD